MIINNAKELVIRLEDFYGNDNFLFRGHEDARYELKPNAFRKETIARHTANFPHTEIQVQGWIARGIAKIKSCTNKALAATSEFELYRISHLLMMILQYNHALYHSYSIHDFQPNEQDKRLINIFQLDHWSQEQIFTSFLEHFHLLATPLYAIKDRALIKPSVIPEELTGLDQSYPQHYGMPTAALDWSFNPYVALYFALGNAKVSESTYLDIWLYKQIIGDSEDSPVLIRNADALKNNQKALAQEGTFTYFSKPCSFYLQNGDFPSITSYEHNFKNSRCREYFKLKKFSLLRNHENIEFIKDILKNKDKK